MINFKLSKKGQRKINTLYFKGMLLDFIENKLDTERKKSFLEYINENPVAKEEINNYQGCLNYLEDLSKIEISNQLVEQIKLHRGYWDQVSSKIQFNKWPQGLRWSLEALSIIFIVSVVLVLIPWEKLDKINFQNNQSIVLTQLDKMTNQAASPNLAQVEKSEKAQFEDEKIKLAEKTEKADKADKNNIEAETAKTTVASTKTSPETDNKAALKNIEQPQPKAETKPDAKPETKTAEIKVASSGYLYRSIFSATNIEVVGPKITEKIKSLGGRKAGEVDLGWKKTENSIYYHFTIPEAKLPELEQFLNLYGKAKLVKEKHPRVMPEGIIRLIITIEEASKK